MEPPAVGTRPCAGPSAGRAAWGRWRVAGGRAGRPRPRRPSRRAPRGPPPRSGVAAGSPVSGSRTAPLIRPGVQLAGQRAPRRAPASSTCAPGTRRPGRARAGARRRAGRRPARPRRRRRQGSQRGRTSASRSGRSPVRTTSWRPLHMGTAATRSARAPGAVRAAAGPGPPCARSPRRSAGRRRRRRRAGGRRRRRSLWPGPPRRGTPWAGPRAASASRPGREEAARRVVPEQVDQLVGRPHRPLPPLARPVHSERRKDASASHA